MPKTIEIECPECGGLLEIDVEKQVVLTHREKPKKKKSLDDFLKSQANRSQELEEKFKAGKAKAQGSKARVNEKFADLLKKKDELDSDEAPETGIMWD